MIKAVLRTTDGSERETTVESRDIHTVLVPVLGRRRSPLEDLVVPARRRAPEFGQAVFKLAWQNDDRMFFRCHDPEVTFEEGDEAAE